MAGNSGDEAVSVSLDAIPEPTLRYEHRDDGAVVTHANRAFETAFATVPAGTTLRECLDGDRLGLDDETVDAVCSSVAALDRVAETGTTAAGETVALRTDPGTADSSSDADLLTVATDATTTPDPVGVENVATVVSHDLRNPLDVAKAHLRAARERGDAEHFDRVAESHDRMERIVEDVLTLARGEDTVTPTDSVAIERIARDAWSTVDTGDATLDLAADLPTVEADPPRLRRLFENLFRNSVEHGSTSPRSQAHEDAAGTSSGEPSVADAPEDTVEHGSTSSRPEGDDDDDGVHVRVETTADGGIAVADDGVGIPEDGRDRVFDPWYSSSDRGAGIGLTIVERIADAHGWRVSVPPEASDGARFEFHPRSGTL